MVVMWVFGITLENMRVNSVTRATTAVKDLTEKVNMMNTSVRMKEGAISA